MRLESREAHPSPGPVSQVGGHSVEAWPVAETTAPSRCSCCHSKAARAESGNVRRVAAVPPGYGRLQLDPMDDGIWGVDGFDM
jgi:hypothetical protein